MFYIFTLLFVKKTPHIAFKEKEQSQFFIICDIIFHKQMKTFISNTLTNRQQWFSFVLYSIIQSICIFVLNYNAFLKSTTID